jgi:hypothetical protein
VKLFAALDQFSYSYTVLIPDLLRHLQQDCSQFHEQFKVGQNTESNSLSISFATIGDMYVGIECRVLSFTALVSGHLAFCRCRLYSISAGMTSELTE